MEASQLQIEAYKKAGLSSKGLPNGLGWARALLPSLICSWCAVSCQGEQSSSLNHPIIAQIGDVICKDLFWIGDINGDSCPDLAIACLSRPTWEPVVKCVSGCDGRLLYSVSSPTGAAQFGASIAGNRDIDGDSITDLLVCSPLNISGSYAGGELLVYSGKSGSLIRTIFSTEEQALFGLDVCFIADCDQDSVSDIAVLSLQAAGPTEARVLLSVYSGREGQLRHQQVVGETRRLSGRPSQCRVSAVGDQSRKVLVGYLNEADKWTLGLFDLDVRTYSSRTLAGVAGDGKGMLFMASDYDCGGMVDACIADDSSVLIISSETGDLIRHVRTGRAAVCRGADFDRDGQQDLVIARWGYPPNWESRIRLYSGGSWTKSAELEVNASKSLITNIAAIGDLECTNRSGLAISSDDIVTMYWIGGV